MQNRTLDQTIPQRRSQRGRLAGRGRASLLWGLLFYAIAHAGYLVAAEWRWPGLRDPEFGYKLARLRDRISEAPERPLLLVLGSSRTGQGFRPGVLPICTTPEGRVPLVFNFSQTGSGTVAELVCLRRLLDQGIRPRWVAIEVLPPVLAYETDSCGKTDGGETRLGWDDLCLLRRYVAEAPTLARRWVQAQLAPWYAHRFVVMNHVAPDCLPPASRQGHWKALDNWGWSDLADEPSKQPRQLEVARQTYAEALQRFRISPAQDHALHDLLELCCQERIPAVLYLMPEGSAFQSWYPPAVRAEIDAYLGRVGREFAVPVVDARNWIADELFRDGHHLSRRGAAQFSRRFGEEVIGPLLDSGRNRRQARLQYTYSSFWEDGQ